VIRSAPSPGPAPMSAPGERRHTELDRGAAFDPERPPSAPHHFFIMQSQCKFSPKRCSTRTDTDFRRMDYSILHNAANQWNSVLALIISCCSMSSTQRSPTSLIEVFDSLEVCVGERLVANAQRCSAAAIRAVGRVGKRAPDTFGHDQIFWAVPAGSVKLKHCTLLVCRFR